MTDRNPVDTNQEYTWQGRLDRASLLECMMFAFRLTWLLRRAKYTVDLSAKLSAEE